MTVASQSIRIPANCPQCDEIVCLEWNYEDPQSSRVHCRTQHTLATWVGCTFTEKLPVDPDADEWILLS